MKKYFLFFLSIFFVTICSAQIELEGNKEGVYRVKEDVQDWAPSGITSEPEAIKYIDNFSQAIQNPGTPILVEQSEKILKLKPVFKKLVETEEQFIVYKEDSDKIFFFLKVETKEEASYLILFSIVSLLLMIISSILFKKGQTSIDFAVAVDFAIFAAFAALAATIVLALATFDTFPVATFITIFAATFTAIFAATDDNYKAYKKPVVIYYILMTAHFIFVFLGI